MPGEEKGEGRESEGRKYVCGVCVFLCFKGRMDVFKLMS